MCRRQNTCEAGDILTALHDVGVTRLHGFGFKTLGLIAYGYLLASADSLAWSYDARRHPPRPECVGQHRNCANCPRYALAWRDRLLAALDVADRAGRQLRFPLTGDAAWTRTPPAPGPLDPTRHPCAGPGNPTPYPNDPHPPLERDDLA